MELFKFKKILATSIITLMIGTLFIPLISGDIDNNSDPLVITANQSGDNIEINYEINDFIEEPILIDGVEYSIIHIGEEPNLLLAGKPDIPLICRSIIIPDTAKMKLNVVTVTYKEYNNVIIAPSKGNLLRTVNPDDLPYKFDEIYNIDAWFPGDIATLREPYIIRDFRGQVVELYPIQYNPVTKQMRFYSDITIEVSPDGIDNINCIYRDQLPEKIDVDFKSIYKNQFINFGNFGRYDPIGELGNLLIITYDEFWDEMEPFVEWKNIEGIPTKMVNVSEIGDVNAIKTYINEYYNNTGLTFVLLVGDAAQVPTLTAWNYASDPSYTFIVGDDHYPDLFVGRFSAQTPEQVVTQVEESIEYEKYPQNSSEWYHKGFGVASNLGPGDDSEKDFQHIRNIRTKLMNYTYTDVDELYDGSQGGEDAPGYPTPDMVSTAVNDGRSIANYCGHGSAMSWSSSGFSTIDINNLVNDNMLPFVTSVACNNGEFDSYDECFCEAWLRATNNGEPTGAIAATGSSKSMSWSPPMDAQDEFIDLIVGTYPDNIRHTIGGIHYNGCMHMNDQYGSSGYSETDNWHIFGDPSLQIRTDTPLEMSVIRNEDIEEESISFEISVTDIEGALCALSRNGELLGYEYTDENGYALIIFNDPVIGEEPLDLVITAFNKIPYMAVIPVIVDEPPNIPAKPSGPKTVIIGQLTNFSTNTTDLEGENIYYKWDWGDGNQSIWTGPYQSGETVEASWMWSEIGPYFIKVKAKDTKGKESDWSDHLLITVKKSKTLNNIFFQKLFERYPNILKILDFLLKRLVL